MSYSSEVFDHLDNISDNTSDNTFLNEQDEHKNILNNISDPPHFIAVLTTNPGGSSPELVKEKYDYTINKELYNVDNNGVNSAYVILSKYIQQNIDKKIVVVSEDVYLPSVTINTYAKYNNITTIYISNYPKIVTNIPNNNIVYFGIDTDIISESLQSKLDDNLITYFTFQKIMKIGIDKISKIIMNMFPDNKLHLIIDLQIIDQTIAPSVKRNNSQKNFLMMIHLNQIFKVFTNIYHLDIIGFDGSLDDNLFRYTKITGEVCRTIIKDIFNIKEKSMNVFTEDSRFLIYRPVEQLSNDDTGWYIVRFMTLKERETFLQYLIDRVVTISIDNIDTGTDLEVIVTSTSIQEQNQKSFYTAKGILDYCLFPQEKISMTFELLNANVNR